jgi:hypothetical protein
MQMPLHYAAIQAALFCRLRHTSPAYAAALKCRYPPTNKQLHVLHIFFMFSVPLLLLLLLLLPPSCYAGAGQVSAACSVPV